MRRGAADEEGSPLRFFYFNDYARFDGELYKVLYTLEIHNKWPAPSRFNPGGTRITVSRPTDQTARAGAPGAARIQYSRCYGLQRRREGWAGLARRRGENERAASRPPYAIDARQTPQAKLGY